MDIKALDHLVLTVADIAKTVSFYSEVLGMQAEKIIPADGSTRWALNFGLQKINLHQAGNEFEPKANRAIAGSADLCFLSDATISEWQSYFKNLGIKIIEGPVQRTGAQGPILSIYLRDPDGNLLEISNQL